MLGLDPGLVVHTLNLDLEAKPVAQLAKIFHIELKRVTSQRSTEIASRRIHQVYLTPTLAIQHSTSEEEERTDKMLCRFQKSQ